MIYCDEFHDFEPKLSPIKSKQCLTDIKWFMDRRVATQGERQKIYREFINKILGTSTTPFGTTGKRGRGEEDVPEDNKRQKEEEGWKIEARALDVSTGFPKKNGTDTDINIFIKYLLKLESDNFRDEQRRKGIASNGRRLAPGDDNIKGSDDTIAKNISEIVLTKIFGLSKNRFLELYSENGTARREKAIAESKCGPLHDTDFQNWINVFFRITHEEELTYFLPISINIDQEGSTKNTLEIWKDLIRQRNAINCRRIAPDFKPMLYFTTNATLMDPGEGHLEQLRKEIKGFNLNPTVLTSPKLNNIITVKFHDTEILKYSYIKTNGGPALEEAANDNTKLKFFQIFETTRNDLDELPKTSYSVNEINARLERGLPGDHIYTFYKTFGDLNQTIIFAFLQSVAQQERERQREKGLEDELDGPFGKNYIPIFMTGDISCGMLSALFSKNVITESSGVIGDGLITYLTEEEQKRTETFMKSEDKDLRFLAIVASDRQKMDVDKPKSYFGKSKNLKSKNLKNKNSKNKNSKNKNSEKIIKLAKKYRIKLDKNVVKKIKQLLTLQKKAKELKLRITKKINGKRQYKTHKELLKEIKTYKKNKY